jgi:hypothetical protein
MCPVKLSSGRGDSVNRVHRSFVPLLPPEIELDDRIGASNPK